MCILPEALAAAHEPLEALKFLRGQRAQRIVKYSRSIRSYLEAASELKLISSMGILGFTPCTNRSVSFRSGRSR